MSCYCGLWERHGRGRLGQGSHRQLSQSWAHTTPLLSTSLSTSPTMARRSLSFRLVLLGSLLSLLFLLYASYTDDYLGLHGLHGLHTSCPPAAYNKSGQWVYHPRTNSHNMTSPDDALAFSGFQGCASSREFYWHLAADKPEQWDRFPAAQSWRWVPTQCKEMRKFEPERVVQHLVEHGGWLLIGGKPSSLRNLACD